MSYNIRYDNNWDSLNHWSKRKEAIVNLIKQSNAHIIGTQEGLHHQIQYLATQLKDYSFVGIGREDGKTKGEYAAIFYNTNKFMPVTHGTFWLSKTPDKISVGWDAALERICTYALFKNIQTQKEFWVFNAHFDHKGKQAQLESARLILSKIKQLNKQKLPVVVMGDFNVLPHEKTISIFNKALDDGKVISTRGFKGPKGTFNGFNNAPITNRIDYIFVKKISVKNYQHLDKRLPNGRYISDHNAVLSTIKL